MLLSPMTPSAFRPTLPSFQPSYAGPLQHHMPPTKRPKLSLQTTSIPTSSYGISSSHTGSNRVEMATTTPTTYNTYANSFANAPPFELSIRPSPVSTTASPSVISKPASKPATISRNKRSFPYDVNLPIGVRSILKHSSIATDGKRGSLSAASASPRSATASRRVFFPEPKRVKFGGEETIVTTTFLARHIDLSSSEDDGSSSASDGSTAEPEASEEGKATVSKLSSRGEEAVIVDEVQRERPNRRDSGRRRTMKKKRKWEWTLAGAEPTASQHEGEEATKEEPRREPAPLDDAQSPPSDASTSNSPSIATPVLGDAMGKEPHVAIKDVVLTPTSATTEEKQIDTFQPV